MKNRTSWFDFFQTIFHQKCNIIFDIMFSSGSFRVNQKQKHDGPMMAQRWPNDSTSKAFAAIWSVLKRCAWLPRALAASCSGLNLTFSESGDVWGFFLILVNVLVTFGDLLMILVICWWFWVICWWFWVICWWFWWFVDVFCVFFYDFGWFVDDFGDLLMFFVFFMILGDLLMILVICWCFLCFFLMILGDLLMILVICWCFLCFF